MSEKRIEINIKVLEDRLRLILPGDGWTVEEAKVAKVMSEGMAPAEIEERLLLSDPDAWLAVLRVSYMRAEIDFPSQAIAGQDVLELAKQVSDAIQEARKHRPPTNPSENGSPDPAETLAPDTNVDPS